MSTPELIHTPAGPMTRREIAAHYHLSLGTVIRRLWQRLPIEKVIAPPRTAYKRAYIPGASKFHGGSFITPWGRKSLAAVADILDIPVQTLNHRIYTYRWTEEEALNTPLLRARGKYFIMPPDEYRRRCREQWKLEHNERNPNSSR